MSKADRDRQQGGRHAHMDQRDRARPRGDRDGIDPASVVREDLRATPTQGAPSPRRVSGRRRRSFHRLHLGRARALRQGAARRRPTSHLPAHVRARRALLVVLGVLHPVPPGRAAAAPARRHRDRRLPHGTRGGVLVPLLGPGHLGQDSYGPAGVVLALVSFLVGFGVCLHAGAVFGRIWNDWQDERASLGNQNGRA
jgi:hypothetical protein